MNDHSNPCGPLMSQEGLFGSKFWLVAPGIAPGTGAPYATPGTMEEKAAHSSKEEARKAEAEPYGRESRSRHSIAVVGAH